MAKKRNIINPGTKGQRIPGLKIRLPLGASKKAVEVAHKLGEAELAGKGKVIRRPKKPLVAKLEWQIAETIGKRTFEVGPEAHRSTKYFITGNGRHLTITKGTNRGRKTTVTNLEEFASVIKQAARKMGM
ncbi:MAG: hypothetical protein HON47_00210 [Candidatus Diapherotrites archaeon]|mgnify:CR=1 FL=1|jgi:hypothetical protein|uniref:Uncharacterized protein n=1 Tax=Candidatus Iainarchaeum sp. TaxID=3101447 RepID=A0A8T5GDI1_9ARCH|nr:hypothetical protein [Candidatus Diapherotrites archaeon]MBT7241541.1 hypothetical protein [Candidatus Diapherotrites archaeon]